MRHSHVALEPDVQSRLEACTAVVHCFDGCLSLYAYGSRVVRAVRGQRERLIMMAGRVNGADNSRCGRCGHHGNCHKGQEFSRCKSHDVDETAVVVVKGAGCGVSVSTLMMTGQSESALRMEGPQACVLAMCGTGKSVNESRERGWRGKGEGGRGKVMDREERGDPDLGYPFEGEKRQHSWDMPELREPWLSDKQVEWGAVRRAAL